MVLMNFNGIINWLKGLNSNIGEIVKPVIAIAAVAFAAVCIIKSMKEFKDKKYKEGALYLIAGIAIGILVTLGVTGVLGTGKNIAPQLS